MAKSFISTKIFFVKNVKAKKICRFDDYFGKCVHKNFPTEAVDMISPRILFPIIIRKREKKND